MQQRYHLKFFDDFHEAVKHKHALEEENPDKNYQIRKKGIKFDLVVRLGVNEIKNNPENIRKQRRKR